LNLKINKAAGPDDLPGIILQELAEELSVPLTRIFNKSLHEGIVPQDWKTANVTPIHKKEENTSR
jgi:hypothetical protein